MSWTRHASIHVMIFYTQIDNNTYSLMGKPLKRSASSTELAATAFHKVVFVKFEGP